MRYSRVYLDNIGYELAPEVVTSTQLEARIAPVYERLHLHQGQLAALTGVNERRWWEKGYSLSEGAAAAAKKALDETGVKPHEIEALVYTGVCRENFEPATACAVAEKIGVSPEAFIYDISNACLGVMNGIIDIANRIELKQIRAGMVVSCESAREINEVMIHQMIENPTMDFFTKSLATLTGGSGAAAVILTDGSFGQRERKLIGGYTQSAPEHHRLCRWGITLSPVAMGKLVFSPNKLKLAVDQLMEPETIPQALKDAMQSERIPPVIARMLPTETLPKALNQFMSTDSVSVLKHGVELGVNTWTNFLKNMGWAVDHVDKVICHQVGHGHRQTILKELGIGADKDYNTYPYLGNIGTVSLPMTAAIAEENKFLQNGNKVGFLGIGSGLNCLMLGWEW